MNNNLLYDGTFEVIMMIASLIVLALTASRSFAIRFLLIMGVLILQTDKKTQNHYAYWSSTCGSRDIKICNFQR